MADDGAVSDLVQQTQPSREQQPHRRDGEAISPAPSEATYTDDLVVEDLQSLRPRARTSWDESWDEDGVVGERWECVKSAPINLGISMPPLVVLHQFACPLRQFLPMPVRTFCSQRMLCCFCWLVGPSVWLPIRSRVRRVGLCMYLGLRRSCLSALCPLPAAPPRNFPGQDLTATRQTNTFEKKYKITQTPSWQGQRIKRNSKS